MDGGPKSTISNFTGRSQPLLAHNTRPLTYQISITTARTSVEVCIVTFSCERQRHELRKRKRETRGKRHQWRATEISSCLARGAGAREVVRQR
jgi:hypothetical protein